MELTESSKVYIMCHGGVYSGGPTLLHQLGARLQADGIDAAMYYYPVSKPDKVHDGYKHYGLPVADSIEDSEKNVLIVPETLVFFVPRNLHIQRILWWLSVDNWWSMLRQCVEQYESSSNAFAVKPLPFLGALEPSGFTHWVQSEYARQFLLVNGVPTENIMEVGDYIDDVFLQRNRELQKTGRQNIVAFNPRKGWEFTRKLMEKSLDLAWRPVENMTAEQVEEFLHTAKVYVDFGNHPGKDRIPREAVMAGCCLLTSRRGAAANAVDIPIPDDLKYDDTEENIPVIVAKIRELLADYEQETERLSGYRQKIMQEQELFARQVRMALGYEKKTEKTELILSHVAGGGTEIFLQDYLRQDSELKRLVMRPEQAPQDKQAWEKLLRDYRVARITVNHLLGFPLYDTLTILPQLSVPYDYYLHDYFCMCPNWSLDCKGAYCDDYRSHPYCRYIFQRRNLPGLDLADYRRRFREFLRGAERVIAPTGYAAGIVSSMYPETAITVQPHRLPADGGRTFQRQFAQQAELTLTFLGNFYAQKGARYIVKLNEWLRRRQLPVRLVVMGENVEEIEGNREGILFSGRYEREKGPELLARYQTAVVLIPSAFPETYCYTASEAILAGYPVLTMNLGAQALRVQKADCGWVLNRDVPDRGQLALQRLVRYLLTPQGRQEILTKAENTRNFHNGME